jgi:D-alanine transaminase
MSTEMLYLNGTFMPLSEGRIPVEDRGLQLGDGVYDVVKIMNGRPIWLEDHLARLDQTLEAIGMNSVTAEHRLDRVISEVAALSEVSYGMVYVQVTRGVAPREFEIPSGVEPTVLAYARSRPAPDVAAIPAGMVLHPVEDLRWVRCDIKCTDLLAAVLAKEEARKAGAHEALLLAPDGTVREGGSSNIFAVIGGVLRTHPLDESILAGITRGRVLNIARRAGYAIEERAFTVAEVTSPAGAGCEVFVASTLRDIAPVVRIGTQTIGDGRPGRVTLALLGGLRREQALVAGLEPPDALS